jgi:hypothetical protein
LGCACTQPSTANVLKNPGFDHDVAGWDITAGSVSQSSVDVENCPYSGALAVSVPAAQTEVHQCVAHTPLSGTFNFGARILVVGDGSAICGVRFFPGDNCDGTEIVDDELNTTTAITDWQSPTPESGGPVAVTGANSVLFFCELLGVPPTSIYLDQVFVSRIPYDY